jgi:hypothetical protein
LRPLRLRSWELNPLLICMYCRVFINTTLTLHLCHRNWNLAQTEACSKYWRNLKCILPLVSQTNTMFWLFFFCSSLIWSHHLHLHLSGLAESFAVFHSLLLILRAGNKKHMFFCLLLDVGKSLERCKNRITVSR